jgi:histidinol-phosphate aminotransferase
VTIPRYQWQPTTAEIASRAGIDPERVIRFDHNTSPFPSPWAAELAVKTAAHLNEYPGASYAPLRTAAATYAGVDPENVVPGAGADELILLAGRAFLSPGARAVATDPTYTVYRIATMQAGATYEAVPRSPDLSFPEAALIDAARDSDLTWLCVPDNPIGDRISDDTIAAVIAATDGLVVIDAAYSEYAGDSWAPWVERHHNLLVLHTMSKAHSLAAIRVGYAMGHQSLIDALDGVRPPGSISTLSSDFAIAALSRPDLAQRTVEAAMSGRDELAPRLLDLGFRIIPSVTNFLLCEVGPAARSIAATLMAEGLVIRTFPAGSMLEDYLRFTIRDTPAHDRLIDALRRSL